jgi:hypothetical protein
VTLRRCLSSGNAQGSISNGRIYWCRQMKTKARLASRSLNGRSASLPPPDHWAILEGRTIYPTRVLSPRRNRGRWALKSGANWRKIGGEILKGKWRGFPVYVLSLEERATCPVACRHWRSCYGNHMQLLERMDAGPDLEWELERETALLSIDHPNFCVRLHGLGDFYSVEYVELWRMLLKRHSGLHVYGYTARQDDDIADALRSLAAEVGWSRFAMRFSNAPTTRRSTVTIEHVGQKPDDAIVCPEQIGKTESCTTCALCWATEKRIAFVQH